jgi:hypothetical protein
MHRERNCVRGEHLLGLWWRGSAMLREQLVRREWRDLSQRHLCGVRRAGPDLLCGQAVWQRHRVHRHQQRHVRSLWRPGRAVLRGQRVRSRRLLRQQQLRRRRLDVHGVRWNLHRGLVRNVW